MKNKHILIIGAGPAGIICGKHLINQGLEVTIIERSIFPRFVIGESLLPVSMEHFEEVGVLEDLEKENWEIKRGATFISGDAIFEIDFSQKFTENAKEWTWQVPRAKFDHVLAENFIKAGGKIEFGASIQDLNIGDKINCEYLIDGHTKVIEADFLVDSSGFSGVSSRFLGKTIDKNFLDNSSLFAHFEDTNMHLMKDPKRISFEVLAQDLWLWMIPFYEDYTSIGVAGSNKHFDETKDKEEQLRSFINQSKFKDRFEGQKLKFDPVHIQNYSQKSQELVGENYCLIGNCAEFLDPVFSSGVAFATGSGLFAAKCILGDKSWEEYKDFMNQGVNVFKDYVSSWYDGELQNIFFSDIPKSKGMIDQITSVLAGYVWDLENPFVEKSSQNLTKLNNFITKMSKKN